MGNRKAQDGECVLVEAQIPQGHVQFVGRIHSYYSQDRTYAVEFLAPQSMQGSFGIACILNTGWPVLFVGIYAANIKSVVKPENVRSVCKKGLDDHNLGVVPKLRVPGDTNRFFSMGGASLTMAYDLDKKLNTPVSDIEYYKAYRVGRTRIMRPDVPYLSGAIYPSPRLGRRYLDTLFSHDAALPASG